MTERRAEQDVHGRLADTRIPVDLPAGPAAPRELVPAGGAQHIRLIEGMDGVLRSNEAVAVEVSTLASELKIINDRQRTMYGQSASAATPSAPVEQSQLVDAFKQAIDEGLRDIRATLPTGTAPAPAPAPPSGPAGGPPPPPSDWLPVAAPGSGSGPQGRSGAPGSGREMDDTTAEMRGNVPEAQPGQPDPGMTPKEQFEHTRDYFGGKGKFTLSNLRQDFGRNLAKRLDNVTYGEQLVQDPMGNWRHASEIEGEYGDLASDSAVEAFMRREKLVGAARGAAGALSSGSTMGEAGLGMLGAGGAKALGAAGAVIYAGGKALDFAETQRAANNQWVSMTGGDQTDAFGERFQGRLFRLGMMGTLSGGDADALYRGVAATGMDEDQRGNAQDFAVENYKDLGMSISESLDIINFAAQHNQESLRGVADALRDVTDAAAEAGVNTETARQSFVQNWKTFSEVFEGPAATTMAAGFTSAQMQLGREFQNLNFSGAASPDIMRMISAANGQTYNQTLAQSMEGGAEYAGQYTDWTNELISNQLGPQAGAAIMDAINNRPNPDEPLSDGEVEALQEEILAHPEWGVPDLDILSQILGQMTGVSGLEPANVLKYSIRSLSGEADFEKGVQERIDAGKTTMLKDWDTEQYKSFGGSPDLIGKITSEQWQEGMEGVDDGSDIGQAYREDTLLTGRVGGISQALASGDDFGVKKVEVETEGGPRVLDLEDAMAFFRDQIDAGTAEVVEGDAAGVTIAEATKMTGDSSVEITSAEDESLSDLGDSKSEFEKEGGGSSGKVTISPSPYLLRFFQFSGTGSVNVDPETFREPPLSDVTADGRPTGSSY